MFRIINFAVLTWWCHHCVPGRTSGCGLGYCKPRPLRLQSTPPLFLQCSTGYSDTGGPCIHGSTPALAGSVAPSYQTCRFRTRTSEGHKEEQQPGNVRSAQILHLTDKPQQYCQRESLWWDGSRNFTGIWAILLNWGRMFACPEKGHSWSYTGRRNEPVYIIRTISAGLDGKMMSSASLDELERVENSGSGRRTVFNHRSCSSAVKLEKLQNVFSVNSKKPKMWPGLIKLN